MHLASLCAIRLGVLLLLLAAGFFECEQLTAAEGFVVGGRCGFDQILKVGAGEEVP